MDILDSLQKLGFSQTESKIYLSLLKIKEATAVTISKHTELHRRTIYDNLNLLHRKGLINKVQRKGINYFQATNPKALNFLMQDKLDLSNKIMPSLTQKFEENKKTPNISVYAGIQGTKAILEDLTKTSSTMYWVGGSYKFGELLKYSKGFVEEKFKKLNIKAVQADDKKVKELQRFIKKENLRTLPKEFLSNVGYAVCDNKTAIGILGYDEMTTILIESKDVAKAFKNYFKALWLMGK